MARKAVAKAESRTAAGKAPAPGRSRANDPDATRADIIEVALKEFADKGLSGARIDEIAEQTRTSKRMIYYYFESKEGLYRAVLEECYRRIRSTEHDLDLERMPPLDALRLLVTSTFDYQDAHPDFIRLVMVENINHGEHINQLPDFHALNVGVIDHIKSICERGAAAGVIRKDVDPVDLHMTISALCFFNVSNRHTFSRIFRLNMGSKAALKARRESVADLVVRSVAV
ncbi:MAG: TetR/AcrR family transcriptional regulator [Caulobacteraceae bacterium]